MGGSRGREVDPRVDNTDGTAEYEWEMSWRPAA